MSASDRGDSHIDVVEQHLHPHLKARMLQRGITKEEIERTLNEGWEAADAKPGTKGKVFVFAYEADWEERFFEVKEVTVYYRMVGDDVALLTAKARYGKDFPRR